MRDDPQLLSKRLADFVRPYTAKDLAGRIGCDVRTAENMREGHWPLARHWMGLIRTFGEDITEAVFHPEKAAQRLEREVHDLERQLAAKRKAAADAAFRADGVAPVRPGAENRASEVRSFGGDAE